jgi:crossover junction endodeoxyribonuclease RuvC
LGIDPGTLRLGYGVIECAGPARQVATSSAASSRLGARTAAGALARSARAARAAAELRPDAVAMEEAFYGRTCSRRWRWARRAGVALFVAAEQGLR